jgi:acetyl-CoA decarbonylase/synthase complex subunit delta
MQAVQAPIKKWAGKVHQVKLGEGARSVIVGGEATLPFLQFEGSVPHPPLVAAEVRISPPANWPPTLLSAWGDAVREPGRWAEKAEERGANAIALYLNETIEPEEAISGVKEVLSATSLPLIVLASGATEKDNEALVAVAEATRGKRIALGFCEEKNYRTIAAACLAQGHVVIARTPIDVNLAKQLNILITDIGLPLNSILIDPNIGALGYGLEYAYSVIERLRLTGLSGDAMTAMPIFCTVGGEMWRQKEALATEGVPPSWGEGSRRGILWEEVTGVALLHAGADILVLRHPRTMESMSALIDKLMSERA